MKDKTAANDFRERVSGAGSPVQPAKENETGGREKLERERWRWLLMIYDSIVFVICFIAVFVLHPSMPNRMETWSLVAHFLIGYASFFGFRMLLKGYKLIWRFGSLHAFGREFLAGLLGGTVYVVVSRLLAMTSKSLQAVFLSSVAFAALYIILSLLIRYAYVFFYRFAKKETPFAKTLRKLMMRFMLVDFDAREPGGVMRYVLQPVRYTSQPINEVQNIAEKFAIRGEVTSITQLNKGYINRTYKVETLSETGHVHMYTLQRINTNVFPDVDALMDNFTLTTEHLYGKFLLPGHKNKGSVQRYRPTKDGRSYLRDDSGCWRMMTHFDGVYSLDIPDSPETFYYAGRAFGKFIREMSDVNIDDVKVVIPNFHNTRSRYQDLEKAIALDPKGRAKNVAKEIEFFRQRADGFGLITDALVEGRIPTRVCHNDCNLNNILFDEETHLPVAIIDLDTVMPSSPLYDYGDSMRIGTNTATDDEKDLSKVSCDLNLYEQYARGYLEECGFMLTPEELELLPYASLIITSEDGIRFLMDYINGDTYYHIFYPGQNLDRAHTQMKLLEDMEAKLPQIKAILKKIYRTLGLKAEVA